MKTIFGFMLIYLGIVSLSFAENYVIKSIEDTEETRIDTFTFSSGALDINGKIFLPASFSKDKTFHAIYLIDFTEQHFKVAKDEFEKVISATEEIQGLDAVVITLEEHLNVDANPSVFQKYYDIYKNMTSYVDANYTNNTSRTFIGRGSEAGLVLMALFLEDSETSIFDNFIATDAPGSFNSYITNLIRSDNFPKNKLNKKLHFSFSRSNNRIECLSTINAFRNAQYTWLQFESKEYTSDYENTYPAAFAEGLKYVFNDLQTGLEENSSTPPRVYQLKQNYPNPFNPSTTIGYSIPNHSYVSLKVYDGLGREVAKVVNQEKSQGNYNLVFSSSGLSSGTYFYRLQAGNYIETKKMVLIK